MNKPIFDLSDKTALVTGANTGLGQAIALALGAAGAKVVVASRSSSKATLDMANAMGIDAIEQHIDLAKQSAIDSLFSHLDEQNIQLDILVNNAGIIRRQPALEFSPENWDDVLNVNLRTVFFLSQQFAKRATEQNKKGKIINIASMLSYQGGINVASYTASKSGVQGLTRLLANEWAKLNINVNAIAPGYFATNNTEALRSDEYRNKQILERIPCGRWGKPEDLGGAAVFLASQASDYLHGTTIDVDGGWLAR